jgi:hypothetical protein
MRTGGNLFGNERVQNRLEEACKKFKRNIGRESLVRNAGFLRSIF